MTLQLTDDELKTVKSILTAHLPNADYHVFGSRAKGTAKRYSDLDITLVTENPIPLQILSTLEEKFVESDLSFKVDLVDWQRIDKEFQEKIRGEWVKL